MADLTLLGSMFRSVTTRTLRILTLLSALAVIVLPGGATLAQDSGIGALMEEITVTARKREESLQDTPIAVSVFSGESLEARGVQRLDEIAGLTPNMSFDNINTNGGGGNSAAVFLRGVGQRDFLPSADPGVGIYVDGVYFARSVGSVLDIIDIDRVEVLRGPQGTLFGRNTTGGAIAIHTRKPHEEFEGKVRVRVGTDDRADVLGKVNIPLSDTLFMSATVGKFDQDGFIVNENGCASTHPCAPGELGRLDTGDDDTLALRGALRWQASDNFEVNISGDYSRDRENGQARVASENPNRVVDYAPGQSVWHHNVSLGANSQFNPANGGPGLGAGFGNPGTPFARDFSNCDATPENPAGTTSGCANANTIALGQNTGDMPTFSHHDVYGFSGTVDWQLSENLQIKSITAYRNVDSTFAHDGDNTPFYLSWVRDQIYKQEQFTQELQLQGTAVSDRLQWIIGGFYFTEDGNNYNPVDFAHIDIESGAMFDHESIAAFAQGTFDITDKLHLTAGVRYTEDTKDFIVTSDGQHSTPGPHFPMVPSDQVNIQSAAPVFAPTGILVKLIADGTTTLKANDWTPMANISYDVNDNLMTYFTYAEGFKSGGIHQRNAGVYPGNAPTYDPEFVESFEIGFKYSTPDGRFVLNTAAFYADYTEIQLETLAPEGIAPQLDNAGEGEIKGFEIESRWSPLDTWFLEVAIGHLDATITRTRAGARNSGFPSKGDRLPQVPRWSLASSLIKEFGLGDMGAIIARLDYNYRTKVFFSADNDPGSVMQSHGLLNASLGWDSASDKLSLTFHANNIFDKRRIIYTELAGSGRTQNDILARDFAWYLTGEYRF
ncbi:MAG: TonB-dependent receptor [Gammaproteobacteria bacterium]|nr:TonB-dependent receptor [Gammaproteobacteria bacterium]MCY4282327.1 TonB-dependent receptor [Gammaproteobacteria bacterium]MCY4338025.1 TonB-dependent receptor [Gammaproteobacteria bacterium]